MLGSLTLNLLYGFDPDEGGGGVLLYKGGGALYGGGGWGPALSECREFDDGRIISHLFTLLLVLY